MAYYAQGSLLHAEALKIMQQLGNDYEEAMDCVHEMLMYQLGVDDWEELQEWMDTRDFQMERE